jgi:hypothetical protein
MPYIEIPAWSRRLEKQRLKKDGTAGGLQKLLDSLSRIK